MPTEHTQQLCRSSETSKASQARLDANRAAHARAMQELRMIMEIRQQRLIGCRQSSSTAQKACRHDWMPSILTHVACMLLALISVDHALISVDHALCSHIYKSLFTPNIRALHAPRCIYESNVGPSS